MKIPIICLSFFTFAFYIDSLLRLSEHTLIKKNDTLSNYTACDKLTLFELIDHQVTNYFIVFQNCFIFAFGSTCYIIQSCVFAYFETLDCLFKYLTVLSDHVLVFPNSVIFILAALLIFMPQPKKNN